MCGIYDVMSVVSQMAYWSEFFIAIYVNIATILTAAALVQVKYMAHTNPVFQYRSFPVVVESM